MTDLGQLVIRASLAFGIDLNPQPVIRASSDFGIVMKTSTLLPDDCLGIIRTVLLSTL